MGQTDLILSIAGILYGALLISSFFVNNKFIEAFRLDTMFMRQPPPAAKGINLIAGLAIIGYNVYTWVW